MPQGKHNIEYRKSFNLIILQILTPYANMNTFIGRLSLTVTKIATINAEL